ncbi:MAG: carbamoyltransferase HypF, partial [Anaerolineales bacterium]
QILASGAELKNTFCLTRDNYAFISHHIGDLENYETYQSFTTGIEHYQRLFRVNPAIIAYDKHPNYLASRYALQRAEEENIPAVAIQHHHAHIASCLADNNWDGNGAVIGVSFDGTGYGDDGAIWGGEFLISNYQSYERYAHLQYFPLPGGDRSIRYPARIALAYLYHKGIPWDEALSSYAALCQEERQLLRAQLEHHVNLVNTSSMGRLFDLIAALLNIRQKINYEAQAAIELEAIADLEDDKHYPFELVQQLSPLEIDVSPMVQEIIRDCQSQQIPINRISTRFHNTITEMTIEICKLIRGERGLNTVVLSGGVWQNVTLLTKTYASLSKNGFHVLIHHQVPANDGGISLGQALIASFMV